MPSYKELMAQISTLSAQAEAQRKAEVASVVAEIKAKMKEYDLTTDDLGSDAAGRKRVTAGRSVAPKYRDDATGETWTGRGKMPRWMAAKVAQGLTKESFLIPA